MSAYEVEGGCLCGATRFRVEGDATSRCFCHCRSCRLASGAPFVAWATFPLDGFRLLEGRLAEYSSSKGVVRGFCPSCGTAVTYAHEARASLIDIALAALDEPSLLPPEFHIWVSHKLSWVVIGDGLPQYPRMAGERGLTGTQPIAGYVRSASSPRGSFRFSWPTAPSGGILRGPGSDPVGAVAGGRMPIRRAAR